VSPELVERLRPRRIETGLFEIAADDAFDPVSVLGFAAKREAKYSLPLREIDIVVNSRVTEAGVLCQDPRLSSSGKT